MGNEDATLGMLFLGFGFASMMYGVACIQTWSYYTRYARESLFMKATVGAAWASDTLSQALLTHAVYMYLVKQESKTPWSLVAQVCVNGVTALIVQSFFTHRVWRLSRRNVILLVPIVILLLGRFASVLAYTVRGAQESSLGVAHYAEADSVLVLVLDAFLAVSLCILLSRVQTEFRRTRYMVNKLILYALNTMLLMTFCAICVLVTVLLLPKTMVTMFFCMIQGELYVNSFLATLNVRDDIISTADDVTTTFSTPFVSDVEMGRRVGSGNNGKRHEAWNNDANGSTGGISILVTQTEEKTTEVPLIPVPARRARRPVPWRESHPALPIESADLPRLPQERRT